MTASKSNRNLQCKKWEKDRRERLNESFNALAKLLPCYEPSVNISKIEILTKSAEYITILKCNVEEIKKTTNVNETTKRESEEIKALHLRVTHLTTRNKQLSNLLKDANISIPSECGGPIREKAKKWSGKISPEKAEEIKKSEAKKENKICLKNVQGKKSVGKGKPIKLEQKKKKARRKSKDLKNANNFTSVSGASTLTITNVQPIQPYYIIANNIASTITTQATTVKNVITTPIISTTNCQGNKPFSNGIILPVVQPQTLLNPPLLLNTSTQGNTVYVVKANKNDGNLHGFKAVNSDNATDKSSKDSLKTKKLPLLRPKRRVFTRIGNKLPIPPSKYDSSSLIIWSGVGSSPVSVKKRTRIKRKRNNDILGKSKVSEGKPLKNDDNKKQKVDELNTEKENGAANKPNSAYSIDALCKENESPTSKDIENVINEVVEKANAISTIPTSSSTNKTECHTQNIENQNLIEVTPTKDTQLLPVSKKADQNQLQNNNQDRQELFPSKEKVISTLVNENSTKTQIVSNLNEFSHSINQPNPSSSQLLNIKGVKSIEPNTQNQQNQFIKQSNSNNSSNNRPIVQSQLPQTTDMLHNHEHQTAEELNLHSELSNDIFASLQVQGGQNPDSTSPTAAFLNAFPLVSSFTGVKVTEVLEEETTESPHGTPTLLQIGNMEAHNQKSSLPNADNLTPNMINLDNFNFFNNNLYNNFDSIMPTSTNLTGTTTQAVLTNSSITQHHTGNKESKVEKMASVGVPQRNKEMYNGNCQSTAVLPNAEVKNYRNINANNKKQVKTSISNNPQTSQEKPFYNTGNTVNNTTSSVPSTIGQSTQSQTFYESQVHNTSRAVVSSGINFNSTNRYNEYNTFNPFELPKTTQSFGVKTYEGYSNNCNYNYQSTDYNYQIKNNYNYDVNINNCSFYNSANSGSNNNAQTLTHQNATNNASQTTNNPKYKKTKEQSNKQMVNWMAPEFCGSGSSTAAKVTSYSDIGQLGQNSYLYSNDYQNSSNVHVGVHSMEHQTHQEHQFPWSPTKLPQLLETPQHFPPSTLPTLVGDLALGIGSYSGTQPNAQPFDKSQSKVKSKKTSQTYEPGNILSVSQLVDHGKDTGTPTRVANRRNSGNRSHKTQTAVKTTTKRHKEKEKSSKVCSDDWESSHTKRNKNPISYSAESLIAAKSQQNYPKTIPPYLPENILPYFPHNIDENFTHTQGNQSYQNNTFPGNYNNSFIPSSTSTTYLPTNNFISDIFDNPVENIFSHVNTTKNTNAGNALHKTKVSPQKTKEVAYTPTSTVASSNHSTSGCVPNVGTNLSNSGITPLKSKRKKESFVDLSFLSMPSINSPLLPEDFHGSFLPPPPNPNQLYSSCKNPIYKQSGTELGSLPIGPLGSSSTGVAPVASGVISAMSGVPVPGARAIQHPEISPAPGSLTNFNLCTIFPEINRTNSVVPDVFRNYGNNPGQKSSNFLPNLE